MLQSPQKRNAPIHFFALVFLLSLPFWVYGALVDGQLLPGLPVSSVMVVCPTIAAGVLTHRAGGRNALKSLFASAIDFGCMQPWAWLVALGTMPLVMTLSAVALLASGQALPAPEISLLQLLGLLALFLVAATLEELGWTAYATGKLVRQRGLVVTALIVGTVAVVWHLIPLLQVDRPWDWIVWWAAGTMARRMIIVWLYVRGGQSVFSASLFHAMNNVSWMAFPVMGSHYDPVTTALILCLLAAPIVVLVGNIRGVKENLSGPGQ